MGGPGSGRRADQARRQKIARLRARGLSLEEIGHRLGVTRQAVSLTLRHLGLAGTRPVVCRECGRVIVERPTGTNPPAPTRCLACLARHPETPVGERLRSYRLAAGLTQDQLAEQAGVSRWSIGTCERGVAQPTQATLLALARLLGEDLLGRGRRSSAHSPEGDP